MEIQALKNEIDRRVDFIRTYAELGECHMVDFFLLEHWNTLVHPHARTQLMKFDENNLYSAKNVMEKGTFHNIPVDFTENLQTAYVVRNLKDYLTLAKACSVEKSMLCENTQSLAQKLNKSDNHCGTQSRHEASDEVSPLVDTHEYMCSKKSHEVKEMSYLVHLICQQLKIEDILDMGSGKGYLGTHLSLRYGLNVVGVDCSKTNAISATARAEKFLKYWNAYLKNKEKKHFGKRDMRFLSITAMVDADTDINFLFTSKDQGEQRKFFHNDLMLTGLHACGDLSSTALRTFVSNQHVKAICLVGCCYNHLTCRSTKEECGFPMSEYLQKMDFVLERNTKMLGLKALDRIQDTDVRATEEKSTRSLFYRAALSVILAKELGFNCKSKDLKVGKIYSKSKDFIDYVRKSLSKLSVNPEACEKLSDETITSYLQTMEKYKKSLLAFSVLREAFSPAVEAIILLDKLLYLKEKNFQSSYLVKLFDPIKSPRCYALVSAKL